MAGFDHLTRESLAERLRAAEAALASASAERALAGRLEALGAYGHWVWWPDTNRMAWSDHLYRLHGREPDDAVMTLESFRALIHPDDRGPMDTAIAKARLDRLPFAFEARVGRGHPPCRLVHHVEVTGGADGQPLSFVAHCKDVSRHRAEREASLRWGRSLERANVELQVQAESLAQHGEELQAATEAMAAQAAAIERQHALLESLVAHVPAGIAALDPAGRAQWLNPAMRALIDRHDPTAFGPVGARTPGGAAFESAVRDAIAIGRPTGASRVSFTDDAREARVWDGCFVPLLDAEGRVTGALAFAVDVTERERDATRQRAYIVRLEQLDRFKDEFLAVLSHELRTPLNFIVGFGSILEDDVQGSLNDAQRDSLSRMMRGTQRMVRLVDDLLEIARIRAGKVRITLALEALGPIVSDVVRALALQAEAAGLALSADVEDGLTGCFDAERVAQVLTNLIGNAIKFTPPGGHVRVSARLDGEVVLVEVADDGPGVPPEAIDRIFGKFEQVDMSHTRAHGGIGLGLAIAQGLIEAHGGAIGVRNAPASGATFWFTLPVAAVGAAVGA